MHMPFRRIRQEEEEELELEEEIVRTHLATPIIQTSPPTPTPQPQNGTISMSRKKSTPTTTPISPVNPFWLPSVGALQLSDSSILKRRELAKRKRKAKKER